MCFFFFFQAEDGIRDGRVTGVQTCALPISRCRRAHRRPGEGPARVRRPRPGDARRRQHEPTAPGDDRRAGRPRFDPQPVARRGGRRPGRAGDRGHADHPLARPGAVGRPPAWPAGPEGQVVTLGELTQRLSRADFLDGLGIYVGTHEVALAHVVKRFFTVALRHARTYPLPPAAHAAERRQALGQAVLAFAGEHHVDTRRAYLCLPRTAAACNRVLLPVAARENLSQVLEYEIEHLVPLPRDQVYFDYSVRALGEDRLEILLMCIPKEVVRVHLEALEDAFVRPRGIVLASTAIADYLAFCCGETAAPIGLLIGSDETIELALVKEGRLVASQLVPANRVATPADLSRSLARQLADGFLAPEDVQLYH